MKSLSSSFRRGTKDKPSDPNATPKESKVKRSVSLSTTKVAFGSRQSKGEAGAPAQSSVPSTPAASPFTTMDRRAPGGVSIEGESHLPPRTPIKGEGEVTVSLKPSTPC